MYHKSVRNTFFKKGSLKSVTIKVSEIKVYLKGVINTFYKRVSIKGTGIKCGLHFK